MNQRLKKLMSALKERGYKGEVDVDAIAAWQSEQEQQYTWPVRATDPATLRNRAAENGEVPITRMVEYLLTVDDDGSIDLKPMSLGEDEPEDPAEVAGLDERSISADELRAERANRRGADVLARINGTTLTHINTPGGIRRKIERDRYERRANSGEAAFGSADEAEMFAAFFRSRWVRDCPRLAGGYSRQERDRDATNMRALGTGVQADGGATVPEDFDPTLIVLKEQFGAVRQVANVVTMSRDTLLVPRLTSEVDITLIGENVQASSTKPQFDNVELTAKKIGGVVYHSNELLNDSALNIADEVALSFARALAEAEDKAYFNGDGTSTFYGVEGFKEKFGTTPASFAGLKEASGNAFSEFTLGDFQALVGLLPQYADQSGQVFWAMHRSTYMQTLDLLIRAAGGSTTAEGRAAFVNQALGYPVVFTQVLPKADANSQIAAYFGNFGQAAKFGEVSGSNEVSFSDQERFSYDQTVMRVRERVAWNVHDIGDATDAGPVTALISAGS